MPTKISKGKIPRKLKDLQTLFSVVEKGKTVWEATFDAIRDPVLIISKDYTIERANRAAGEKIGVDVRGIVGRRCYDVFAGREEVCPGCPLEETVFKQSPRSVEIEKLRGETDFQVNSYPLLIPKEAVRVVHHYRDTTEERRLQRHVVQSEKLAAIGLLAGGVAHEINNPLGGILAFTQLMQTELPPDSSAQSDLKEIREAAERCKRIVDDLLSFARPSSGLDMSPQNVNLLLEKLIPLLKLNLKANSISIETQYGKDLPPVLAEANRLQQVFLNLIRNAAEAMREGGAVKIRTGVTEDRSELYVEIVDQGRGIKEEDLPHIFDPFFTTKGQKGTGLGLSICDSIIHDHQGRIDVESQIGRGSVFRITLPVFRAKKAKRGHHDAIYSHH